MQEHKDAGTHIKKRPTSVSLLIVTFCKTVHEQLKLGMDGNFYETSPTMGRYSDIPQKLRTHWNP